MFSTFNKAVFIYTGLTNELTVNAVTQHRKKTKLKGVKEMGVQKAKNIFVDVCNYTP